MTGAFENAGSLLKAGVNTAFAASAVAAAAWLSGSSEYPVIWALVFVLFIVAAAPVYVEHKMGLFDLFNLKNAFVLYFTLQFGVWTVMMLTVGPRFITSVEGSSRGITLALCFAIAGLLSFYAGYYSKAGSAAAGLPYISGRGGPGRMLAAQALLVMLSLAAFLSLMRKGGGFGYFVTHIDEFRTGRLLGTGYLFYGIGMLSIAFLIYASYSFAGKKKGFMGVYAYALACIAVSLLAGFRHMTVHTLVYLLVARNYLYGEIRLKLRHAFAAAALVVLNTGYVVFRSYGYLIGERDFLGTLSSLNFGQVLAQYSLGRFHGTESLARIIEEAPRAGFQYGRYYALDVLSAFIPRVLWAEKPMSSGLRHNTVFWPDYFQPGDTGAIIPTLAGELYWMAGITGIVIGMFAVGVLLKAVYVYMTNNRSPESVAVYAVTFWFAYLTSLAPLVACLLFIGGFRLKRVRGERADA
jgi:hypothetical protein